MRRFPALVKTFPTVLLFRASHFHSAASSVTASSLRFCSASTSATTDKKNKTQQAEEEEDDGERPEIPKSDAESKPMSRIGVDVEASSPPGTVRFEVQATVMQSKMRAIETRIEELKKQLSKQQQQQQNEQSNANSDNSFETTIRKSIAAFAAQWMSGALNLSSLFESEGESHLQENRIVLREILEKLDRDEFKKPMHEAVKESLKQQEQQQNAQQEDDEEEPDFLATHDESIRVATLVRLARVEHDLGDNVAALMCCDDAIAVLQNRWQEVRKKQEDQQQNRQLDFYSYLVTTPSIRHEWLFLCKLRAMVLSALGRVAEEQDFLRAVAMDVLEQFLSRGQTLLQVNEPTTPEQEVVAFLELLVRYADSLGLTVEEQEQQQGTKNKAEIGWSKPDAPVFREKKRVLTIIAQQYSRILSPTQPLVLQARASLALDCGAVAMPRQESVAVLRELVADVIKELDERQQRNMPNSNADEQKADDKSASNNSESGGSSNNSGEGVVSRFMSMMFKKPAPNKMMQKKTPQKRQQPKNTKSAETHSTEDLFALHHSMLIWKRKLALAHADLKQFDESLKLLEETSKECDSVLGAAHVDSVLALRCWARVAFAGGHKELSASLSKKLDGRAKPPSI